MDEEVRLRFLGGAEGQFLMRAVQGIAGLEGDDAGPAELAEMGAKFVRRVAAALEIVVDGLLDAGNRATQIDLARLVVQVVDRRVGDVVGAEDALRLFRLVGNPLVGHRQDREDHAFRVAQRDVLARLHLGGEFLADVEVDGHRPERAVGQPHLRDDAVVIRLGHEALERVEPAVHQKLEVADLALGQIPGGEGAGLVLQLLRGIGGNIKLRDRSEIGKGHD